MHAFLRLPGVLPDHLFPIQTLPPIRSILLLAPDTVLLTHVSQLVQVQHGQRHWPSALGSARRGGRESGARRRGKGGRYFGRGVWVRGDLGLWLGDRCVSCRSGLRFQIELRSVVSTSLGTIADE